MRKWVVLDTDNSIKAAYETDCQQLVDPEVFTDLDLSELIGKVFIDSNTIQDKQLTLQELKEIKLHNLVQTYDDYFSDYMKKYPEVEAASFYDKKSEAFAVNTDNTLPLNLTPYLSGLIDPVTIENRNALAAVIVDKVNDLIAMEKAATDVRARILAANNEDELDNIIW